MSRKEEPIKIYPNPRPKKEVWICGKCGKNLSRLWTLRSHMMAIHKAPFTRISRRSKVGNPSYRRGVK